MIDILKLKCFSDFNCLSFRNFYLLEVVAVY